MRWIGLCLLFVSLTSPLWAEVAKFPVGEWFDVENLNGKDVRGKRLTFFVHDGSGGFLASASGGTGCHSWGSAYQLEAPDRFKLVDGIGVTTEACPDALAMQLEREYLAALAKVTRWRMDGSTLQLSGDQAVLRLVKQ
jgi:heat shock protein HslJ